MKGEVRQKTGDIDAKDSVSEFLFQGNSKKPKMICSMEFML
jgi:hypothetical protein